MAQLYSGKEKATKNEESEIRVNDESELNQIFKMKVKLFCV